jgi:aminomethyltransferase
MIRTTPFHERTGALNESGLWSHWSGYLAAEKYSLSEKFEYFAVRNAAGLFDTSPLFKYRFTGPGAEAFLGGVLARDPRVLEPGRAQYAIWCDDRGFIVEDGVLLRHGKDDFVLTAAEPNFAYFADLIGRRDDVRIEEVSEQWAVLSLQGPRSRGLLAGLDGAIDRLDYFEHAKAKIGGRKVTVSRTGFTGDLGYEVWAKADDALAVWDAVSAASRGHGVLPFGLQALYMTRIEAGLLLLDVDFHNSRFAWTDGDRATPHELGLGWMLRGIAQDDRRFIGRDAILRELADGTSRFRTTGLVVDWRDWDRVHDEAGLIPPKDHTPVQEEMYVYDDDGAQVGYATSFMYSPVLQRHIAIARVPLAAAATPGTSLNLEIPVSHRYVHVTARTARMPLYNPARKTAGR